ncbi:formylmethanofuran dehydrogenase [Candidatus Geothermarchaeota archaeon]|nr:MAG: formylmethanofuran dehydrogenase [Candidatus Geothermarchaeota archaeon]
MFEEAARFHGHLGPFLILGCRMGLIARKKLRPKGIHDLQALVRVSMRTPFSCVLDGIQFSSSCTLGKGNLKVVDSAGKAIETRFSNEKTGSWIRIKVKEEIVDKLLKMDGFYGVRLLMRLSDEEIFSIEGNEGNRG